MTVDPSRCPICGEPNRCGELTGDGQCWCVEAHLSKSLLEQIPPEAVGRACVCPRCAKGRPLTLVQEASKMIKETIQDAFDKQARPPRSLPLLEELAGFLGEAQGSEHPKVEKPEVLVFAGDHGVARDQGVNAFPVQVTPLMMQVICEGTSSVSVLAVAGGAEVELIDVGVAAPFEPPKLAPGMRFVSARLKDGTEDLSVKPAMTLDEAKQAIEVGREAVRRAKKRGADLIGIGELGIGNTTPAAAMLARLLNKAAIEVTGPGTGLNTEGVQAKAATIERGLARTATIDPLEILAEFGGFEHAAMTGAILEAETLNLPVLLDGFVVSASAVLATRISYGVHRIMYPATKSAEPGHLAALAAMGAKRPVFDAGLRLGEASAAALAIPVCRAACALLEKTALLADVMPK